jgi:hypothetical protein
LKIKTLQLGIEREILFNYGKFKLETIPKRKVGGCEIVLQSYSFFDVYSVTGKLIRELPRIARAFEVREAREEDISRELWGG